MGFAWMLHPEYRHLAEQFGDLDKVFSIDGERLTRSPISEVIRVEFGGLRYYIKRYWAAGKGLRRWLGRPRIASEWQNLQQFEAWDIPTPVIVAWGCEQRHGIFTRGAMITLEVPDTQDLAMLAHNKDSRLQNRPWLEYIGGQLALYTRTMHDNNFMHNDLKWRNILVDQQGKLFFIDCPSGAFWTRPFRSYRIVKDLACIDKVAKNNLSRTNRLRFYLKYKGHQHLQDQDKHQIRRILDFFKGRE